jgi:hypothetical protein
VTYGDNEECWEESEQELSCVLHAAVKAAGFPQRLLRRYTASATEQEIAHRGLLDGGSGAETVFCFFRHIMGLPEGYEAQAFHDCTNLGSPDNEARLLLNNLKNELRKKLSGSVHEYQSVWNGGHPSYGHLDQLCDDVYSRLSEVILEELSETTQGPHEWEIAAHSEFGAERARFFVGRAEPLRIIKEYLCTVSQASASQR